MNKLRDRFGSGVGVVSIGTLLAMSLGGAVADRAIHPLDTYRDIQKRRAAARRPRLSGALGNLPGSNPQEHSATA